MAFPLAPINGQSFTTPDGRSYIYTAATSTWVFASSSTTSPSVFLWGTVTASSTATNGQGVFLDSTGGVFTITLPLTPVTNDHIAFVDIGGALSTNNVTVARNTHTIMGLAQDMILDISGAHFQLIYSGTDWRIL